MITQQHKRTLPFDDQNYQLIEYEDFFFNEQNKKIRVKDLGQKFASINSFFYEYLKEFHIPCAFIKKLGKKSLLFIKFSELPFVVKILNQSDKRTAKIFSIKQGTILNLPVFEYHYGNAKDSVVSEGHLISFNLCSYDDLRVINRICTKINAVIKSFFERREEFIGEISCSFGKFEDKIYLIDDFTPLSLKIFNLNSNGKLPDPYKLDTMNLMKKYTDHLFKFTSG